MCDVKEMSDRELLRLQEEVAKEIHNRLVNIR